MPFPATRHAHSHVGATRDQGSGARARAHSKIRGLLRCRQPAHRKIRPLDVSGIQCGDLRRLSPEAVATSFAWPADGHRAGQRPVPPRRLVGPVAAPVPGHPDAAVPATVLSATRSHRAGVEARPTTGHAQPVLRHAGGTPRYRRNLLRRLATTESSVKAIMRHQLRRYV